MTAPTILLVEDDPPLRTLTTRSLQENGYTVRPATSAHEMWLAFDNGPIDLVLLDIMLPGIDGLSLLDALRDRLGLTGTKKGCDHGQCGACTVLVDGQRINSCLTLAVMHDGREITTVEGLALEGRPHPVQQAFMDHDGFQCGYCTPGQVCSTVALLRELAEGQASAVTAGERPPALSDEEIRERMSGNLCRCGAYQNIVAAIRSAARRATRIGAMS